MGLSLGLCLDLSLGLCVDLGLCVGLSLGLGLRSELVFDPLNLLKCNLA